MQFFFLDVAYTKRSTLGQKIKRIDWTGNGILVAAVTSILIALSWADARYPWTSWRILTPLLLGFVGIVLFHAYEKFVSKEPTVPPRMFGNLTSAVGMALMFLQSMLTFWRIYFLPLYFQSVLRADSQRSGVLLLPTVLTSVPSSIIAGQLLSRFGKYKPLHFVGFALGTLASGLYIDLDVNSSLAKIVIFQMIAAYGGGTLMTAVIPAIQASHPQSDAAPATATGSFYRQFGVIWGVAIPAAIFNSRFDALLPGKVSDQSLIAKLSGGNAYATVSGSLISSLPEDQKAEVISVYQESLRTVWIVCTAFSAFALLLVFLEKEIPMRTTLGKNEYGLKNKDKKPKDGDQEAALAARNDSMIPSGPRSGSLTEKNEVSEPKDSGA